MDWGQGQGVGDTSRPAPLPFLSNIINYQADHINIYLSTLLIITCMTSYTCIPFIYLYMLSSKLFLWLMLYTGSISIKKKKIGARQLWQI